MSEVVRTITITEYSTGYSDISVKSENQSYDIRLKQTKGALTISMSDLDYRSGAMPVPLPIVGREGDTVEVSFAGVIESSKSITEGQPPPHNLFGVPVTYDASLKTNEVQIIDARNMPPMEFIGHRSILAMLSDEHPPDEIRLKSFSVLRWLLAYHNIPDHLKLRPEDSIHR